MSIDSYPPCIDPAVAASPSGVLLIAHQPLAHALVRVAEHVLGHCGGPLAALDIPPDLPREYAIAAALTLAGQMACTGLLVLVDLHGGPTPCVVAQGLCEAWGTRARLVGGVNVAMLLTALESRHLPVEALAQEVTAAGRSSVLAGLPG